MKINKFLYYFLNLTWGIVLTLFGTVVSFFLIVTGHKPKRFGGCWYFNIGDNWGGLEMGLFFITDKQDDYRLKCHEYGHSIQNCIWGPLCIFVITIPSTIRYWVLRIRTKMGKENPDYDSIWFEGQATKWGMKTEEQWRTKQ